MNCNIVLHEKFLNIGEIICPFCDKQLTTLPNIVDKCCSKQDINSKKIGRAHV